MKQPGKTLGQIAAEKVLDDLKDRKGVGDELEQIEPDIYEELQTTLAQIIDSVAQAQPVKSLEEIAGHWIERNPCSFPTDFTNLFVGRTGEIVALEIDKTKALRILDLHNSSLLRACQAAVRVNRE